MDGDLAVAGSDRQRMADLVIKIGSVVEWVGEMLGMVSLLSSPTHSRVEHL